ncbi:hypothetical protein ACQ86N_23210 [Puia sp. P3]|uniref:hypothetical protein n=1 Tax=Puia sp. P3 TaxID=3423952 RepID=UPI003D66CD98
MKKREPIQNRSDDQPTRYYLGGKIKAIPNIGLFPGLLYQIWDQELEVQNTYKLAAVTADFVYYADEEESDETSSIVMLDRTFKLVSDNIFASNDLAGLVERNEGLLWISIAVKYWQIQQFIKPKAITAKIKKMLEYVDVEKLTDKERIIYFAYRKNGPVKYSKPHSLMAVISNDLDQPKYSDQLAPILEILQRNKG